MAATAVTFRGAQGQRLAATIEMPVGPVRATALFAHCFTCTMRSHAATRVTAALAARGIATMRFDFTGLGGSEGAFAEAGFTADIADIEAAAAYLSGTMGGPQILIGHSLGGAAVLAAAPAIDSVRAVATIGAPFDPSHVLDRIEGDLNAIERDGTGAVAIGGRAFQLSRRFLESTRGASASDHIGRLDAALLVLHAPRDEIVGIDNAKHIFDAARHPKSFVTLDDADHLLTREDDARYVAELVAAWVERYLSPIAEHPPVLEGAVIAGSANGRFGTFVRTSSHQWIADEPARVGGEDAGPSPYDMLLAALGACTSMTVKLVAAREGVPLDTVEVLLNHARDHARDCDRCDSADSRIEAINRTLTFTGDLTEAQRVRLTEIADKCPVHRTLTGTLHVYTRMAGGE